MKKFITPLYIGLFSLLLASCAKNKSKDFPLPVVRKEAVYITTANNNLISYHPSTGNKQWEIHMKGNSEGVPALYNKKLYLVTNNGYFYVVDILRGEITLEVNTGKSSSLSVAAANDRIYVSSDMLYCFDLNGSIQWQYDPTTPCTSSPTVANGKVYLGAGDRIHSVDAGNGSAIWTSPSAGGVDIVSSPKVSNGLVYFGGQDKKVYALNESNGTVKWEYLTGDKIKSSPIVYGGMCLIGSEDFGVYCIDTTSPTLPPLGELRWKLPTLERVYSSPTVHESSNTILVGSYDFNLYAIDHVTGLTKWKYPAGSLVKSSPVVYGDNVYFTSFDKYIYCVDCRFGTTIWKSYLNGNTDSSPMVDDLKTGIYPGNSGMSKY
ncbi:MAG: PQQ-binding-like beta-propeller repeat protein [Bacteroidetes bacterium]|nr:PQQ-binding-like beta-propeller repeat protein [Bacteroidota bacterium]